jgi:hypothetical protein
LAGRRFAVLLTPLAGLALGPPALASPTLIEGRLAAPAGTATAAAVTGNATVFLDETDTRPRGTFRAVASGPVKGGSFQLAAHPTPLLRRAARRGGGWLNLLLMVRTPAGKAVYPFTRRLTEDAAWSARSARTVRLPLAPYPQGAAPVVASQHERADCEWKRSRDHYRYTRVGQLHQWDGFRSAFHYATGAQADSWIGAAVSYGDDPFKASGERHITKTNQTEHGSIIRPNKTRFSRYVQTRFTYYYFYLVGKDCNRGPGDLTRVLRAGRHVGGSYYKPHDDAARVLDGHCHTIKGRHRLLVAPRSTEWTQGGKARSVGTAIKIFGVTLGSQSGWSRHVRSEWRNVGSVTRAICSVYGDPNNAPVTYVGGIVRE